MDSQTIWVTNAIDIPYVAAQVSFVHFWPFLSLVTLVDELGMGPLNWPYSVPPAEP